MKNKKIKKVLVTGGAGFIGSWVVDELILQGYDVTVLDTLGAPTHNGKLPPWCNKKAKFIRGDVCKKKDWEQALRGADAVIHLASRMDYHLDFGSYVDTNIKSIALLFELMAEGKAHPQQLIVASSQAVYGEGAYRCVRHGVVYPGSRSGSQLAKKDWEQHCPQCGNVLEPLSQKEEHELHPMNPYGISKLASEWLAFNLGQQFGVTTTAMRYSIALGPRQSFRHFYSGALRSFSVDVLSGKPITMHEDARQIRDFVDVRDVARAHTVALGNKKAAGQTFNLGSGKKTRVMELAKMVANAGGVAFNPSLNARYRLGAPRHGAMDASKAKKLLGWEAKIPLAQTVNDYYVWLSNQKGLREFLDRTEKDMRKKGLLKEIKKR